MKLAAKKALAKMLVLACTVMVPAIGFCQPPGPGDDSPDVPFDSNMNLAFLALGLVFAAVVVVQEHKKRRELK
jgi:hypothetical protein